MNLTRDMVANFGAGPAALPTEVLQRAQNELLNFRGSGMSVMEISHRSKMYEEVHFTAENRLRSLYGIGEEYSVLFLQGGASLQFAMLPMNLRGAGQTGAYVMTGAWADKAFSEAGKFGEVRVAASSKEDGYRSVPSLSDIELAPTDAYLHVTSNETIGGVQWQAFPDTGDVPLCADMSSDILSRVVDVNRFGLIYAGAQKNLGPSGVTVVIIRNDLVERVEASVPSILRYATHAKNKSLYNTPPTLSIYLLGLVLEWLEQQGGVAAVEAVNEQKAATLYSVLDESQGYYRGHAVPSSRSRMNVSFRLPTPELEQQFLEEAKSLNLVGLAGHRSVGGIRASIYNAVSLAHCQTLANLMRDFATRHPHP